MLKNIMFCADGTWNHPNDPPAKPGDPAKFNTNVAKLADQHDQHGNLCQPGCLANSSTQLVIYDNGVGTGFPIVLGGAFGVGVNEKIGQGYAQIVEQYEKGDRIFLFGFSRGAYTARCLAGMLWHIGLPTKLPDGDRKAVAKQVAELAFRAYAATELVNNETAVKPLSSFELEKPVIAMQGMWDTVGSLGFSGALIGIKDPVVYGFLDTDLHENTEAAFHAMSIDSHRGEFVPTRWQKTVTPGQLLKEVWFTGVHSDVGGSAKQLGSGVHNHPAVATPLADITLGWMLRNAKACGAELSPQADRYLNRLDPAMALVPYEDSFKPVWLIDKHRDVPAGATIANSVAIRLQWDPTYRPRNLKLTSTGELDPGYVIEKVVPDMPAPHGLPIPSNSKQFDTGFDVVAGQQYRFTATGTWIDKDFPADADGDHNPGFVRDVLSIEKKLFSAEWMAMIGRIGNGKWFKIGTSNIIKFDTPGRLFCCANDAELHYANNQGSIILTIEPI